MESVSLEWGSGVLPASRTASSMVSRTSQTSAGFMTALTVRAASKRSVGRPVQIADLLGGEAGEGEVGGELAGSGLALAGTQTHEGDATRRGCGWLWGRRRGCVDGRRGEGGGRGVDASLILEFGDACVNSRRRVTRPSGVPRLRVVALGV